MFYPPWKANGQSSARVKEGHVPSSVEWGGGVGSRHLTATKRISTNVHYFVLSLPKALL